MPEHAVARTEGREARISPKPKVLRRPSNLVSTPEMAETKKSLALVEPNSVSTSVARRRVARNEALWHEDQHFMSFLVGAIFLLNVVLYYTFSTVGAATPTAEADTTVSIYDSSRALHPAAEQ